MHMVELPEALTVWQYCAGCIVTIIINFLIIRFNNREQKKREMAIAEQSAKLAIEKSKIDWEHETETELAAQISDAITASTMYSLHGGKENKDSAILKLNIVRVKTSGNLGTAFDSVYYDIDSEESAQGKVIRVDLSKAIDSYRKYRRENAPAQH